MDCVVAHYISEKVVNLILELLVQSLTISSQLQGLFTGLICGLGTQMITLSLVTLRTDWKKQVIKMRLFSL